VSLRPLDSYDEQHPARRPIPIDLAVRRHGGRYRGANALSSPLDPTPTQRTILSTDDLSRVAAALKDLSEQLVSGYAAKVRVRAGANQTSVAQKIGVDQRTLSAWETGTATPKSAELALRYHLLLAEMEQQPVEAGSMGYALGYTPVPAVQRL